MPKRDLFQVAFDAMQQATGYAAPKPAPKASAVKGGLARAKSLSKRKRKEIAQNAAELRWAAKASSGR